MSIVVTALLFDRYGPRLSVQRLAEVLGIAEGTIYNQISAEAFPIPTYKEGKARWADVRDVAEYLDMMRAEAA